MKKMLVCFISTMMLLININPVDADYSAANTSTQSASITEPSLSISEISEVDQYVIVQNNRYVLSVPEETTMDSRVLHTASSMLERANNYVYVNNLTIDDDSKKISSGSSTEIMRAYAAHQTDQFWWGVRHIFRTNAAAEAFASDLETCSTAMGSVSAAYGLLFATGAGLAVSLGASAVSAYCGMIANSVRSKKLQFAKIELDISWAFVYRVIEWHD